MMPDPRRWRTWGAFAAVDQAVLRPDVLRLLMELDDHNCWTIADAVSHRGPHWLQDLLAEDQSGYVASIISRRITFLQLMRDLDNTPLG